MKISFENPDKINGLLAITVEEADYKDEVDKTLKDYRRRANIPGFRPGQAPIGMIKRQVGAQVKVDAINKLLGEQLQKYIVDNNIEMLGQPMAAENQGPVDLDGPAPYEFKFDIAVSPEIKIELTKKDKLEFYDIVPGEEEINQRINFYQNESGQVQQVEDVQPGKKDLVRAEIRELDENGNALEGGLVLEKAMLMPDLMESDSQKELLKGAKAGDIVVLNLFEAFGGKEAKISQLLNITKDEVEQHKGNFSIQIMEVTRLVEKENNKELWDAVCGKDAGINDEKAFREAIAEQLKNDFVRNSDYRFIQDLRAHCEKKVGKLQFPDAILKRVMLANNKEKGQEFVDKNYEASIKELTWHLIKEHLAKGQEIKVDRDDLVKVARDSARVQYMQFGIRNPSDDMLNRYVDEMLKNRENFDNMSEVALEQKIVNAAKDTVTLKHKSVSLEEFNKMESKKK